MSGEGSVVSGMTKAEAMSEDAVDFKQPSESKQILMYLFNARNVISIVEKCCNRLAYSAPSTPNIGTRSARIER